VYKPHESAGYAGSREPPFEVFVAAGIVYGRSKRIGPRHYNAPISEVEMFPRPLPRSVVTDAFPEWKWLRHMRGEMGAEVPRSIEADFLALIDRLAYGRSTAPGSPRRPDGMSD
jgi:hypothetical protein